MSEQRSAVGISNRKPPEEETRERHEHPPTPEDEVEATRDEPVGRDRQVSSKTGVKASAQKNATTRHTEDTAPSSAKVEGAFGKESRED